jgi:hypothetical protein
LRQFRPWQYDNAMKVSDGSEPVTGVLKRFGFASTRFAVLDGGDAVATRRRRRVVGAGPQSAERIVAGVPQVEWREERR